MQESGPNGMGLRRVGSEATLGRSLFHLTLRTPEDLPSSIELPSQHFAALVVWDSTNATATTIAEFAERLLRSGAVYVCTWGSGCDVVHDIFDEVDIRLRENSENDAVTVTTWHVSESFEETLWFFLTLSRPGDQYLRTCSSGLVVSVGRDKDDLRRLDKWLASPDEFIKANS